MVVVVVTDPSSLLLAFSERCCDNIDVREVWRHRHHDGWWVLMLLLRQPQQPCGMVRSWSLYGVRWVVWWESSMNGDRRSRMSRPFVSPLPSFPAFGSIPAPWLWRHDHRGGYFYSS